jgi:hypothetical protein
MPFLFGDAMPVFAHLLGPHRRVSVAGALDYLRVLSLFALLLCGGGRCDVAHLHDLLAGIFWQK